MFSSSYFNPEYFNEHFRQSGTVIKVPNVGGGYTSVGVTNFDRLRELCLRKDDQDVLEMLFAFVLSEEDDI